VEALTAECDINDLPRDAMQARPMPLYGVRPSVCLSVTFVYSVKTNKHGFRFFRHRAVIPFKFFRTKQHGNIPSGIPLTGVSNGGEVGRNRDSAPISGSIACCQRCDRQVLSTRAAGQWQVVTFTALLVSGRVC